MEIRKIIKINYFIIFNNLLLYFIQEKFMEKEKSNLQHDKFYRDVFSIKENLEDLLKDALPRKYFDMIDFKSLNLSKESFIGEKLKQYWSDMVVDVKMNNEDARISLLIEHKANHDKYSLLQMLRYLTGIWYEEKRNNANYLTPVIPILIYHGTPSWKKDNNMSMCFENSLSEDLKDFIPMYKYILFDLNNVDDKKLIGNIQYIVAIKIMKHIHKNLLNSFKEALKILSDYLGDKNLDDNLKLFLDSVIDYINNSEEIEPENIDELMDVVSNSELKEVIMTLEKKYEIKYKKEKAIEIAKKMKEKGTDIDFIIEVTGLSKDDVEKL
jgi:predicted transposase/invertase (TIGR01784 family)